MAYFRVAARWPCQVDLSEPAPAIAVRSTRAEPLSKHRWLSFFASRWRGEVRMHTLLWRDMLCVGTAVNLLATFIAVIAASQGSPSWAVAALHFAPLPYNIFLFAVVGRVVPRSPIATTVSLVWMVLMTVV